MSRPVCGKCLYDLSGSEGIRCPECGSLFVDVGIKRISRAKPAFEWRRRHVIIALLLISVVLVVTSAWRFVRMFSAHTEAVAAQRECRDAAQKLIDGMQEILDSMETPEEARIRLKSEVDLLLTQELISESESQHFIDLIEKHIRRH